jgi:hypothetical protein
MGILVSAALAVGGAPAEVSQEVLGGREAAHVTGFGSVLAPVPSWARGETRSGRRCRPESR